MIGFSLTEEQEFIRKLAHDFAQKEMAPRAEHYDEKGEFPWEVVKKAHSAGLLNVIIPEEYGGVGAGSLEECLVGEELFAGDAGMGTTILASHLGLMPIRMSGTDEQQARFFPPFLEEPIMAAFGLTESGAGSDVANVRTSWRRDGDEYVINGTKQFITNGGVASLYTVFATGEPGKRNPRAFSAFIVPRDTPGVSTGKKENKMGHRCSDTSEVIFDNVRVPADHLLGQEGEGFKIAMRTLDKSRAGIASCAVGIARAALEAAIEYLVNRWRLTKGSNLCWPIWRSRSKRPGSSPGRQAGWPTRDCPTTMNPPLPSVIPPTSAWRWRRTPYRSLAAMVTARSIRSSVICGMPN
jgi:acyl-CoA dehydrogenase